MEEENKELFADAKEVPEQNFEKNNSKSDAKAIVDVMMADDDEEYSEEMEDVSDEVQPIKLKLQQKSKNQIAEEFGVRKELPEGTVLTIKDIEFTSIKTVGKDDNGNLVKIPPKKSDSSDSLYYTCKLKVRFVEDNLIEYYPTIYVFVNDGKINENVSINRNGHTIVSQIFRLALQKMAEKTKDAFKLESTKFNGKDTTVVAKADEDKFKKVSDEYSDAAVLEFLFGKKIRTKVDKGVYKGKNWYRNDIAEIL